jgi:hypothetical protein
MQERTSPRRYRPPEIHDHGDMKHLTQGGNAKPPEHGYQNIIWGTNQGPIRLLIDRS